MAVVWKHNGKRVPGPEDIPQCGDGTGVAVRGDYSKPVRLESMGFLAVPEDVEEHRRRFPNIELRIEDGSAIPVVRSLGQRRAYQDAAGWADVKDFR